MALNINKHTVDSAANKIHKIAADMMGADGMKEYYNRYKEIVEAYEASDLVVQSVSRMENFQPFKDWLPYLIEHKDEVVINLVYNMLKKDTYAFNIYNIVQKATGSENLLLEYSKIRNDTYLWETFKSIGGDQKAIAVLNAIEWMNSSEAANDVNEHISAHEDLCAANGMLGVSNNFIDCNN